MLGTPLPPRGSPRSGLTATPGPPAPLWVPWGCHPPPWGCPGTPGPISTTQGPLCPCWDGKRPQNEDFLPRAAAPQVSGLGGRRRARAAASFASASIKGFAQRPAVLLQLPEIRGEAGAGPGGPPGSAFLGRVHPALRLGPGSCDAKICRCVAGPRGGGVTPKRPPQPQTHRGGSGAPVVLPPPWANCEGNVY